MASNARKHRRAVQMNRSANTALDHLVSRSAPLAPSTVDNENRSVEVVMATETPVMEYDYRTGERMPTVLLASGMMQRKQLPLLNNHQRYDDSAILGSVRNIRVEDGKVVGQAYFAKRAEQQWELVREGHANEFSIGRIDQESTVIRKGETAVVGGKPFTGPVRVVTEWLPRELSLTPVAADPNAVARSSVSDVLEVRMDEKLKALCVRAGMAPNLDDEKAWEWFRSNQALIAQVAEKPVERTAEPRMDLIRAAEPLNMDAIVSNAVAKAAEEFNRKLEAERKFNADADDVLRRFHVDSEAAVRLRTEAAGDINVFRAKVLDHIAERSQQGVTFSPGGFAMTRSSDDNYKAAFNAAIEHTLLKYSGFQNKEAVNRSMEAAEQVPGCRQLLNENQTWRELAKYNLRRNGFDLSGRSEPELVQAAFGRPEQMLTRSGSPSIVTANFPLALKDVLNKVMVMGYQELPITWGPLIEVRPPTVDFKSIKPTMIGGLGNLQTWIDGDKPRTDRMGESQTSYKVDSVALAVDVSWKSFVNDDMGVFTRIPRMLAQSANRTLNAWGWRLILNPNNLAHDGVAFFSAASGDRKQANLGSGAITTANINTLRLLMKAFTGLNRPSGQAAEEKIELEPNYIIVPEALRLTAEQTLRSGYDISKSIVGVVNPDFITRLGIISSMYIDDVSTSAWYMASTQATGFEMAFLQGFEQPRFQTQMSEETWTTTYSVVHVYGGAPVDWRAWVKSTG